MAYTNSPLINYTRKSPNHSGQRNHAIDTISIHCMAGNLSIETCGALFARSSTQASSNYGIGSDGRIALYVDEKNRSWCTSSASNDNRAVTIEVANIQSAEPYRISDAAYLALVKLCADICRRNGIKKLLWKADPSLIGQVSKQNMTVHRWFANKSCPGNYLYSIHGKIAADVNKILKGDDDYMTGEEIYKELQNYLAKQSLPGEWAEKELAEAVAMGITDGKNPMQLIPRYQAAIMAKRAVKGK